MFAVNNYNYFVLEQLIFIWDYFKHDCDWSIIYIFPTGIDILVKTIKIKGFHFSTNTILAKNFKHLFFRIIHPLLTCWCTLTNKNH